MGFNTSAIIKDGEKLSFPNGTIIDLNGEKIVFVEETEKAGKIVIKTELPNGDYCTYVFSPSGKLLFKDTHVAQLKKKKSSYQKLVAIVGGSFVDFLEKKYGL